MHTCINIIESDLRKMLNNAPFFASLGIDAAEIWPSTTGVGSDRTSFGRPCYGGSFVTHTSRADAVDTQFSWPLHLPEVRIHLSILYLNNSTYLATSLVRLYFDMF